MAEIKELRTAPKNRFPLSNLHAVFLHLCTFLDLKAVNFLGQSEILIMPGLFEQVATHQKQNLSYYTNPQSSHLATMTDLVITVPPHFSNKPAGPSSGL